MGSKFDKVVAAKSMPGERRTVTRTTKLRQVALVGAAATATLLAGCGALPSEATVDTVLIGVDLELTGDGSALAEAYRNALQLRVEQVNEQGLLGDRRFELDVRDNRSDPETSAANVEELADDPDVVAIITGGCGACATLSVPVANEAGIPMISLAPSSAVTEPVDERPWVFRIAPNAGDNAAVIGAELVRSGAQTIGIVATSDAYGQEGATEMTAVARRTDREVVATEELTDEEGVRAVAERIASYQPPDAGLFPVQEESAGPDAVVVWAPAGLTAAFADAVRAAGYDGPLYLDSIAADELFLEGAAARALAGATMVFTESLVIDRVVATSPAKVARQNWFDTYTARFGTYHAFSVFAADAIQILMETITRLETVGRDSLRSGFERLQIEGISGPLRISPNNHSGLTSLALVTLVVRGERWQAS